MEYNPIILKSLAGLLKNLENPLEVDGVKYDSNQLFSAINRKDFLGDRVYSTYVKILFSSKDLESSLQEAVEKEYSNLERFFDFCCSIYQDSNLRDTFF